jgi:hypothetical protein
MPSDVVTRVRFPGGHPISLCEALAKSLKEAEEEHNEQEVRNILSAMSFLRCGETPTGPGKVPDPAELFDGEPEVYLTIVSRRRG